MAVQEPQPFPQPDPAADAPSPLLLPSLEVKNFRAFRHLTIEKLGRVNLITGKNNVGKTSLLEALWLYAEGASPGALRQLLMTRDELISESEKGFLTSRDFLYGESAQHPLILSLLHLFHDKKQLGFSDPIEIGYRGSRMSLMSISIESNSEESKTPNVLSVRLTGESGSSSHGLSLGSFFVVRGSSSDRVRYQMVRPMGLSGTQISELWNKVHFTTLEQDVTEILQLVAPDVERATVRDKHPGSGQQVQSGPIAFVKKVGIAEPLPLATLGGGMNRLFGFALALVEARDGFLLVDEIENGIHYSVLPDVWRLIFQTARRLNVQVFATTHSWDCIEAFQKAAAEDDDPGSGVLVRLQERKGDVIATVFDEEELTVITREQIEVR